MAAAFRLWVRLAGWAAGLPPPYRAFQTAWIGLAAIFVVFGLLALPLVLLKSLPQVMVCLVLAGFVPGPFFVISRSLMQRLTPENLRGEIFGVQGALGTAGYPLGGILGGFVADGLNAPLAIGLSAMVCILVGVTGFFSPILRNGTHTDTQCQTTEK